MTEIRYEVIPAGYTPEDWAAFGPGIMARLRTELALAEFAMAKVHKPSTVKTLAPSGADLAAMTDAEFAAFIERSGIKTVSDLALAERAAFVHTYKGEGLTACGLEVVGPCPDCAEAAT